MSQGDVTSGIVPISVPDNPAVSLFFFRYSAGRNNGITSRGRCCQPALTSRGLSRMRGLHGVARLETNVFIVSPILTITLKSHFPFSCVTSLFIVLLTASGYFQVCTYVNEKDEEEENPTASNHIFKFRRHCFCGP